MKNAILTILLFSCFLLSAQQNEFSFERDFYSNPTIIQVTSDNKIIIGIQSRDEYLSGHHPTLMMMDDLGEIMWEFSDFIYGGEIVDILIADSLSFYVVGEENAGCHCCADGFIYKFNMAGELLFQTTLNNPSIIPENVDLSPNGDLILISNYVIQRRNSEGELIYHLEYPSFELNRFFSVLTIDDFAEESYLLSGYDNDNVCELIRVDKFEEDWYWDHCLSNKQDTILKLHHFPSEAFYYGLRRDQVQKIWNSGDLFISSDEIAEANFTDIESDADFLYVLNEKGTESEFLKFEKESLEIVDTLALGLLPNHIPVDFAISPNGDVLLVGKNESIHGISVQTVPYKSESSVFLKRYSFDTDYQYSNYDIGVTGIRLAETPTFIDTTCTWFQNCEVNVDIQYKQVYVMVKNHGEEIINSLNVNSTYNFCNRCQGICWTAQNYAQKYNDFILEPGDSLEFLFGDLLIEDQETINGHELCFWTSIPNNKIDKDPTNDLACDQYNIISSSEDLTERAIEIYYNPLEQTLRLSASESNPLSGILEIYDVLGRSFLKEKLDQDDISASILFQHPTNIYFAVYREEGVSLVYKFVTY